MILAAANPLRVSWSHSQRHAQWLNIQGLPERDGAVIRAGLALLCKWFSGSSTGTSTNRHTALTNTFTAK